jgi:hypothetical protein
MLVRVLTQEYAEAPEIQEGRESRPDGNVITGPVAA